MIETGTMTVIVSTAIETGTWTLLYSCHDLCPERNSKFWNFDRDSDHDFCRENRGNWRQNAFSR